MWFMFTCLKSLFCFFFKQKLSELFFAVWFNWRLFKALMNEIFPIFWQIKIKSRTSLGLDNLFIGNLYQFFIFVWYKSVRISCAIWQLCPKNDQYSTLIWGSIYMVPVAWSERDNRRTSQAPDVWLPVALTIQ